MHDLSMYKSYLIERIGYRDIVWFEAHHWCWPIQA